VGERLQLLAIGSANFARQYGFQHGQDAILVGEESPGSLLF
jgi:hypothetical protein